MKKMYFYRNQIIERTPCGKGWYFYTNNLEHNIYKTITDALNGIDERDGNICNPKTGMIPQRLSKPIKVIGKMTFILDSIDDQGNVESHYEYEWF